MICALANDRSHRLDWHVKRLWANVEPGGRRVMWSGTWRIGMLQASTGLVTSGITGQPPGSKSGYTAYLYFKWSTPLLGYTRGFQHPITLLAGPVNINTHPPSPKGSNYRSVCCQSILVGRGPKGYCQSTKASLQAN